jgi:hypothetical protein
MSRSKAINAYTSMGYERIVILGSQRKKQGLRNLINSEEVQIGCFEGKNELFNAKRFKRKLLSNDQN